VATVGGRQDLRFDVLDVRTGQYFRVSPAWADLKGCFRGTFASHRDDSNEAHTLPLDGKHSRFRQLVFVCEVEQYEVGKIVIGYDGDRE